MAGKHTPGPWSSTAQDGPKGKCFVAQVWRGSGACVAEIEPTEHQDEATANARLIAAAPELLEAIGPLLEAHIRLYGKIDPTTSSAGEEQQRAIAAIAKATGAT